jgi:hypothetical protein
MASGELIQRDAVDGGLLGLPDATQAAGLPDGTAPHSREGRRVPCPHHWSEQATGMTQSCGENNGMLTALDERTKDSSGS